jgi:hypothetical protein
VRDVERGAEPLHDAELSPPPPEALVQVTVTAETGTAGQLVKVEAAENRPRFQVLRSVPETVQYTVVAVLPATTGESGSAAAKVTVAGVMLKLKFAA